MLLSDGGELHVKPVNLELVQAPAAAHLDDLYISYKNETHTAAKKIATVKRLHDSGRLARLSDHQSGEMLELSDYEAGEILQHSFGNYWSTGSSAKKAQAASSERPVNESFVCFVGTDPAIKPVWETTLETRKGRGGIHAVLRSVAFSSGRTGSLKDQSSGIVLENFGRDGQLWRQGARPMDRLMAVDERSIAGRSLQEVQEMIEGIEGTPVVLTLQRDSEGEREISIMRSSFYVIDCLIAAHEDLLNALRNREQDHEHMDYSNILVDELHKIIIVRTSFSYSF